MIINNLLLTVPMGRWWSMARKIIYFFFCQHINWPKANAALNSCESKEGDLRSVCKQYIRKKERKKKWQLIRLTQVELLFTGRKRRITICNLALKAALALPVTSRRHSTPASYRNVRKAAPSKNFTPQQSLSLNILRLTGNEQPTRQMLFAISFYWLIY